MGPRICLSITIGSVAWIYSSSVGFPDSQHLPFELPSLQWSCQVQSSRREGRNVESAFFPGGAGLSPGLCSGPPSIQWDGTITFHFLGPCILGCGQQPFSVSIRSIWNLMWAAWTLDLTGCCPACRVGINNMAQCGLAVCLWYQELVVTQETCQPLSKPDAQVTSFQTTSHESVWNSAVNSVRSSLYFLGGWKPGLNFCHH